MLVKSFFLRSLEETQKLVNNHFSKMIKLNDQVI